MDKSPDSEMPAHSRRSFMWGAGAMFAASAVAFDAFVVEPNRLDVTDTTVQRPDLPRRFDGFTVAHVTDLHIGRPRGAHYRTFETLQRRTPDLVVLTGDSLEKIESLDALSPFLDILADLDCPVFAVHGNWEYDRVVPHLDGLEAAYADRGIRLLANEHVTLDSGLTVVGADDPHTGHFDLERTVADLPETPLRLFLVHAPGVLDPPRAEMPDFDLALAGHTHGGQIRLGPFAPITPPDSGRFVSGLYSTPSGPLYVSRGIGETSLRARFFCPPELAYLTFRREAPN